MTAVCSEAEEKKGEIQMEAVPLRSLCVCECTDEHKHTGVQVCKHMCMNVCVCTDEHRYTGVQAHVRVCVCVCVSHKTEKLGCHYSGADYFFPFETKTLTGLDMIK